MTRETTTWLALVASAAIPAVALSLFTPLSGTLTVAGFLASVVFFGFFSIVATLVLGLPTFLLLRLLSAINWLSASIAGFLNGAIVSLLLRLPTVPSLEEVLKFGVLGVCAAVAFLLVWKQAGNSG